MIVSVLYTLILLIEGLVTIALVVSILFPQHRVWPPVQTRAWSQILMVLLFHLSGFMLILLGILDWGKFTIPGWLRALGCLTWLIGLGIAVWAMVSLGWASTVGAERGLVRTGPYRYSRNPQYLGLMIALLGWGLWTSTLLTLWASLGAVIPLLMVPFAEEPWLIERYGQAYQDYQQSTARFIPGILLIRR